MHVVFVGFQAKGTLGRILVDRAASKVKLFGEEIAVKCQIYSFRGMSAHADRDGLLKWLHAFEPKPTQVFVVHGEEDVCDIYTKRLFLKGIRRTRRNSLRPTICCLTCSYTKGWNQILRRDSRKAFRKSPAYRELVSAVRV